MSQQCWARRDNDQHLDCRLSSTRLCPTYTCPGQPIVSETAFLDGFYEKIPFKTEG
ncbi:MAG: hypothetical protein [Olavius algarvensis Gamma 1 endosymbiont]|nr:MAG: hypothetical protein [Olavius algarvensis Gamma 1 endosymbiont]